MFLLFLIQLCKSDEEEKTGESFDQFASQKHNLFSLLYLILHQYATQIDNKHSMLFCWKGKDLLIRFTIEEAIDVDGGNAKSERERIATVYIKIVVNHSLKALQHNNLYFKVL